MSERNRLAFGLARRLFALLAIAAIAAYLCLHRDQLAGLLQQARVSNLVLAGVLFALLHLIIAAGYWSVQAAVGVHRPLSSALDSYITRLPARYIPGGVWHAFSRYLDLHERQQADKRSLLRVFLLENGIVGATGLALAALALVSVQPAEHSYPAAAGLAAMLLAGLLVLALVMRGLHPRPAPRALGVAIVLLSLNWLGVALAFALFFSGLATTSTCSLSVAGASYLAAASLGFVAVFAPQGWGVAEFVLALLHPCAVSAPVAVAALTGFRIVGALADSALFVSWRVLHALRRSGAAQD